MRHQPRINCSPPPRVSMPVTYLAAPTGIQLVGRAGEVKTTASVFPDDGNRRGESRLPVRDVRDDEEEEVEEEEEKEEKGEKEQEEQEEEGEKHEDEDKDAQESECYSMSASVISQGHTKGRPVSAIFQEDMFMVGTRHHIKDCMARREVLQVLPGHRPTIVRGERIVRHGLHFALKAQEDDRMAEVSWSSLFAATSASSSAKGGLHASLAPTAPAATARFVDRNQQRWASYGSTPDGRVFEGASPQVVLRLPASATATACCSCGGTNVPPAAASSVEALAGAGLQPCSANNGNISGAAQDTGAGVRGLDTTIPAVGLVMGVMPAVGEAPPSIGGVAEIVGEAQPAVGSESCNRSSRLVEVMVDDDDSSEGLPYPLRGEILWNKRVETLPAVGATTAPVLCSPWLP
eukprot:jgi/Undpi1/191/HiC_scaffold_1.g00188.m1